MPAWITSLLRELAPVPKRPAASRIRTSRPRSASSRATASPTTPAPTTITSALSIRRQCSGLAPPGGGTAQARRTAGRTMRAFAPSLVGETSARRELSPGRGGRRADDRQSAGECPESRGARRTAAGAATGRTGSGRALGGGDGGRRHVRRRRGYQRGGLGPGAEVAHHARGAGEDGGGHETHRGRDRGRGSRRWLRARARLPLAGRRRERQGRPAGGEARADPGRGRHAALHAPRGAAGGTGSHHLRRPPERLARARAGTGGRAP